MSISRAFLLFMVTCSVAAAQSPALPPEFDRYVERVLDTFDVPGVGIAVVYDGEVALTRGYGVKDIVDGQAVDEGTLFGIASNTKVFTATALGLLVEEGRIGWDDPVVHHLPWFKTWDPYVTTEITIRDLLVHRSGLPLGAGDLLWWPPSDLDRRQISERLQHLQPVASFRTAYAYDNVLYTVAGEVIEAVSGTTWEDFVQRRILDRVGMSDSNVLHSAAAEGENVAMPHAQVEGVLQRVQAFKSDNTNPAGGINASARDMARWMITQLDSGRTATGDRLFLPATTTELWGLVTPIPQPALPEALAPLRAPLNGYALGLRATMYRGEFILTHTGGLPGYVSRLVLLPRLKLGVAVLTNAESSEAFDALAYRVLDAYLGIDYDWIGVYEALQQARAENFGSDPFAWPDRPADAGPPRSADRYAGRYHDAWYGHVYVETAGAETLRIRFEHTPALQGDLVPWSHDTFIARWDDRELRADAFVTFIFGPEGAPRSAAMEAVSPATDFSYDFHHLDLRFVAP